MRLENLPARPPSYDKKIGLVLRGGGALGSYQAGVYEALASLVRAFSALMSASRRGARGPRIERRIAADQTPAAAEWTL
jgi:hypothetical protein